MSMGSIYLGASIRLASLCLPTIMVDIAELAINAITNIDQHGRQQLEAVPFPYRIRFAEWSTIVGRVGMPDRQLTNLNMGRTNLRRLQPTHGLEDAFGGRVGWGEIADRGVAGVGPRPHRGRARNLQRDCVGLHDQGFQAFEFVTCNGRMLG